MQERRKYLVLGGLGLVGRAVLEALTHETGVEVIAVSRRAPDFETRARFLSVDLTDAAASARAFRAAEMRDVTHVVYAALFEKPDLLRGWVEADQIETNRAMFANVLDPISEAADLRHVTLLQGTKAYGAHLAPMRNPGRERDPRPPGPNFYWAQEDHLKSSSTGARWGYSIMRPQIVCGHAVGSPMNMTLAIAVYAAILRELGEPLRFPGGAPAVIQATDAALLARAILWAGRMPGCLGETFNIANGDVLVWQHTFEAIARAFAMPLAEPEPCRLAETMPGHAGLWDEMVERHGLAPYPLDALIGASWQFADAVFGYGGAPPDAIVSTVKARRYGFHDCIDTDDMFVAQLQRLRAERVVPP